MRRHGPRPPPTPELRDQFLDWRGIEAACSACGGSGVQVYGNTSGWRGGMGGARMTPDVCDRCWGSGDSQHPWTDLRKLRDEEDQRVSRRAEELLAYRLGAPIASLRPAREALVAELERLSRGRKARPSFFYELCGILAKVLKEMNGPP